MEQKTEEEKPANEIECERQTNKQPKSEIEKKHEVWMTSGTKPLGTHYIRAVLIATNGAGDAWAKQNASQSVCLPLPHPPPPLQSLCFKTIFQNIKVFISLEIAFPQKVKLKCAQSSLERGRWGPRKQRRTKTLNRQHSPEHKWKNGNKPRKRTIEAVGMRVCSLTFSKLWLNE